MDLKTDIFIENSTSISAQSEYLLYTGTYSTCTRIIGEKVTMFDIIRRGPLISFRFKESVAFIVQPSSKYLCVSVLFLLPSV